MHRPIRRPSPAPSVVVATLIAALVAASISWAGAVPTAHAGGGACRVHNTRTGASSLGHGANLQSAMDDAERGDTLEVRGRCVGSFTLPVRLHLKGRPTGAFPLARLDARDQGHVFTTNVGGRITDLVLQEGRAERGGGVFQTGGRLLLGGSTNVRRNVARNGGKASTWGTARSSSPTERSCVATWRAPVAGCKR